MLRLLTGARWRIGRRDVLALLPAGPRAWRRARLSGGDGKRPGDREPDIVGGERLDDAVLAEALDDLGRPERYSAEGYARLWRSGTSCASSAAGSTRACPDLVADIAQTIGLDVEVAVRRRRIGAAGLARAHLDAIGDVAARFAEETEGGTLSAFLSYLAAAEEEERGLTPGEVEVVDGAVQILTVHAAKGLEWDVVAVAGLSRTRSRPSRRRSDHWLKGMGVLPFPLRGDRRAARAHLDKAARRQGGARRGRGVRRGVEGPPGAGGAPAGVCRGDPTAPSAAVSRASGGARGSPSREGRRSSSRRSPRPVAAARANRGLGCPDRPMTRTNPTLAEEVTAVWPLRSARAAARLKRGGRRAGTGGGPRRRVPPAAHDDLARSTPGGSRLRCCSPSGNASGSAEAIEVVLPAHLSVSQLVALRRDPQRLARRLRRPLPEAPDPYARRGTAFHLWLERRSWRPGGDCSTSTTCPVRAMPTPPPTRSWRNCRRHFSQRWADRVPQQVEVPFATVVAGVVVRGRMDAVFTPRAAGPLRGDRLEDRAAADRCRRHRRRRAARGVPARVGGAGRSAGRHVSAGFHYVRDGATVRPADLLDAAGLVALVAGVREVGGLGVAGQL